MSFSPELVGLVGERISGPFEENRPDKKCPHRGIDFSCSRTEKPFNAGIYGRVVLPLGGNYGTVSIQPFSEPQTIVQYLHCSEFYIKVGDLVAPWTSLGKTGKVSPTPVVQHLHIQVVRPGKSKFDCWKTKEGVERNFINPQDFPIIDALAGTWFSEVNQTWTRVIYGNTYTYRQTEQRWLEISSATVGSTGQLRLRTITTVDGVNARCECSGTWSVTATKTELNKLVISTNPTGSSCAGNSGCGASEQDKGSLWLVAKSSGEMMASDGSNNELYRKQSKFNPEYDSYSKAVQNDSLEMMPESEFMFMTSGILSIISKDNSAYANSEAGNIALMD